MFAYDVLRFVLGTPDMATDCLVKFVQQNFTNDKAKVTKKIEAMAWPPGSTLTSEALAMAETALNAGRSRLSLNGGYVQGGVC